MRIDTEALRAEILLVAENDGDAYRDGHNAAAAVQRACRQHIRVMVDALREEFRELSPGIVSELKAGWDSHDEGR